MTSKCKLTNCGAETIESDPTEGQHPDLFSCSNKECVQSESWYSLDEWEKLNSDDNRRDLFKELLDHVWCEGVDDYWVKNDGKKWQERLKELKIIPEKWPLNNSKK